MMRATQLPITLMQLVFVLLSSTVNSDYLIIFRGKSKHTSLIAPFNEWLLPQEELKNCYGSKFTEHFSFDTEPVTIGKGGTFRRLIAKENLSVGYSSQAGSNAEMEALVSASEKCVLLHGLYEVWSEGSSVNEAVRNGEVSTQFLRIISEKSGFAHRFDGGGANRVSLNVAASLVEQPWLSSKELHKDIISKFEHLWSSIDSGSKTQFIDDYDQNSSEEIGNMNPIQREAGEGERGRDEGQNQFNPSEDQSKKCTSLDMRIYVDELSGYCVLCRQLAKGLAAPTNSGEGGRDPLPLTGSLRRPLSGVLNTFALKSLPYRTTTAMEPEIAFLMANLARVAAGTRVLDPFSGCCTLLMAAAHLQSMGPSLASANISMGFKNPEDIGERIAVAANDTIDAGIRSVDGDGDREVTAVENYLLGVDANMGDITRIHRNFHAVGRSASLASLSLRWDLAESLLEDRGPHSTITDTSTGTDTTSKISSPMEYLFDAIITDPPYEMAERVRSLPSGTLDDAGETASVVDAGVSIDTSIDNKNSSIDANPSENRISAKGAEALSGRENSYCNEGPGSSVRVRPDAAASSSAVGGVISTLLDIACRKLRVGGRLVFFAPYRDSRKSVRNDKEDGGLDCMSIAQDAAGVSGFNQGIIVDPTQDFAASGTETGIERGTGTGTGTGTNYSDMDLKMTRRKAFRKKNKKVLKKADSIKGPLITADCSHTVTPITATVCLSGGESECLKGRTQGDINILIPIVAPVRGVSTDRCRVSSADPEAFLPPLPFGLVLIESYQQVMSPSFSRWLCVVEKRK